MVPQDKLPLYRFLIILTICSTVGLDAWMILFNNFAVEVAGLDGKEVGLIQSVREIPGFLSLLVIYVMLVLREHTIAALSIFLLGAGLALTGFFPNCSGLLATTLVMSFGFHYYETMNKSLVLQHFSLVQTPMVFSRLRSIAAAAAILTAGLLFILGKFLDYKWGYTLF